MSWPHDGRKLELAFLAALTALAVPCSVSAAGLLARLDGGFGRISVQPLTSPETNGATMSAGISLPLRGDTRATLEITTTTGDDAGMHIPEGAFSGKRSLTTFLLGLERADGRDARGLVAGAGLGVGHETLSDATRGWQDFGQAGWRYPSRNLVGFAFGASAGYRTHGESVGFELVGRYDAVAAGGRITAHAIVVQLGIVH